MRLTTRLRTLEAKVQAEDTVPVFLINRERALAAREPSSAAGRLGVADIAGLAAVTVAFTAYAAVTLFST